MISVIIPCYNEERVIEETYRRIIVAILATDMDFELIFINDGSQDSTLWILKKLSEQCKSVKLIDFSRNFGHQCAVTAGINLCRGDYAVIIDADLQDPPEVIPDMLKLMQTEHANVVYGVRKARKGESRFKLATAKLFYRLLNRLSDVQFPVDAGDFRIIDRNVIDEFNRLGEKNKYIRGLIGWIGFKQAPFYYERAPRFAGETKYPLSKMLKFAMIGVFYFSKKPLDIATSLGFVSVFLGLLYAIWVFVAKVFSLTPSVSGWVSTIMLIIFFGGIQLLTIGILGKYVGNLFDEVKQRPEYIIREKVNFD
ncbi:MAG: glycosyltransferase family 2 protein [Dysgonamonadaceae bacterium]|jgi:dolichol-phosphate mannosyltransferase|nr:glycosyltransferase family 2 protein [Dysgonamonadaceae bacterium]